MFPRFLSGGSALIATAALFLVPSGSRACGPDFPNCYLTESVDELARLPTLSFAAELSRALPPIPPIARHSPPDIGAESSELVEVRSALLAAGLTPEKASREIACYSRQTPPSALPAEFQLYARGAARWHEGNKEDALLDWRELLALPPAQRRHRTTWALYMTARVLMDTDDRAATEKFEKVRSAVRDGFTDTEGLAAASLGWEARIKLRCGDIATALSLYFRQFAEGDPTAEASLQLVLARVFGPDDEADPVGAAELKKIASDAVLRNVVTAWFSARGGPHAPWSAHAAIHFQRWIAALPDDRSLYPAEADRWAWAAYQNGLWEDAARFARRAPADAPASEWVRAMLELRNGNTAGAADHLARAARAFPTDHGFTSSLFEKEPAMLEYGPEDSPAGQLAGIRGALALQREQYAEALRLFLDEGHWSDAAYIAEQVLSLKELTDFVQREAPAMTAKSAEPSDPAASERSVRQQLRHLLARRLVRHGDFKQAREFFPDDVLGFFDHYVAALTQGERTDVPPRSRAGALWEAAQILREHGLEIQGTELEPDYNIWGGSFEWPDVRALRVGTSHYEFLYETEDSPRGRSRPFGVSEAETNRVWRVSWPSRRYHYRQRAAEIALLATTLLPDNDPLTATILNTAGNWLAARYPDDAEIYYKTLVFRCPKTELGRKAAERHWLVKVD
ncbi:MAG TPA: hypothetical protein VHD32_08175 [Candidatus Didemnitutus sp.]|nr:hypothetical protein [Candidatus Didemnitutus sp.]